MDKIINTVVGGRYYVLENIGIGGSSCVYKVKDVYTSKMFALKQYITSDPANREKLLEGMEKELNALKHCSHPVLPKIFNLIKEDGRFYLIMEYVEGINLDDYVKINGCMNRKQLANVAEQLCSGLYYLHSLEKPIIYRDLKPSNIIMKKDGRIKLIDFGISKRYSVDAVDYVALGSVGFAAPEQYGDCKGISLYNTDIRTDIYGIGTTLYFLRTKKKYNNKIKSFRVNGKLRKIIKKCTKINPKDRYQNCIDLLCDIKKLA